MGNRPEFLIIHAALAKIGVVPALVNNNIKGQILLHAINISEARALVIGDEYLQEIKKIRKDINLKKPGNLYVDRENRNIKISDFCEDLKTQIISEPVTNPSVRPPINSKDTLEYIYTSGTTGKPKATELKHQKWLQLGFGAGGVSLRTISSDVQYCCLPLYHNSGINIAWSTTLMHGGTFALRRKFSVTEFWDDIRKYNASIFIYIGELCRYLNNQPVKDDDADNPLKYILGNGMRADYWVEFKKRFDIKKIIEVYGATEGVGALTNLKGVTGMVGKLSAAGVRMGEIARYDLFNESLIKNSDGFVQKCRPGETGMFLAAINTTNPFPGYKSNKDATKKKIIENVFKKGDCYFISGDLMKLHPGEYVSFVDRLGDTFKWKGEVVATNEVADILNRFGSIEDSNVYGVEVKGMEGRAGMAALTLLQEHKLNWSDFASYVIENLPQYARPHFVRIRKEKDATSSFKQIKTELQTDGYDPSIIKDPLYFLNPEKGKYVKLTKKIFEEIQKGEHKF
jgi:acyl-CoA synthetase (AMP-forming)/AMP-acid ligase II